MTDAMLDLVGIPVPALAAAVDVRVLGGRPAHREDNAEQGAAMAMDHLR